MAHISILGTGTMGRALAGLLAKGGHHVQSLGRTDTDEAVTGDIVILAVPYASLAPIAATRGDELAGKVVVDISNPVNFETFDGLTVPADSSAAAEFAAAVPSARVVKAFNTNFGATLASGVVGDHATAVLLASDHDDAKELLAGALAGAGVRAVDAGRLARARELEALGFLQITLAASETISWTGGFALVP
ncbi:NADPH-dependent F420 reductase [Cryptosporangium japonicum]|uniref:NADPH-dependent F420 reductase n=1 Tax=Cryptosporangium japonicum TaxID=80872 RepID=A0ABN0TZH5_9ACTN